MTEPTPISPIARRRLGRTNLPITQIGLGGATLLGRQHQHSLEHGADIVRYALKRGINFVDTAECYGESERAVGLGLEGYEGECFLATKFGHIPSDFDFSRQSVLESVQRSRERLRYRPIDLLQLHTPPEPDWQRLLGQDGALAGMREARERGWCRFLGTTGNNVTFLRRCLETEQFDTMLVFLRYDLLDQSGEALIKEAYAQDVGVILASPLRIGLFGGARRQQSEGMTTAEQVQLAALEALFAEELGGIMVGAIQFARGCAEAATVLSGAASREELDQVLEAVRTPLRPELEAAVRQFARDAASD
jgi:aryl-alcohol dehydrogenase-like predicted oxidoreductase